MSNSCFLSVCENESVNRSVMSLCKLMDCSPPGSSVHGISRQEYWSGLPFPSSRDLPDSGIKPRSPTLQADALTSSSQFYGLVIWAGLSQVCCSQLDSIMGLQSTAGQLSGSAFRLSAGVIKAQSGSRVLHHPTGWPRLVHMVVRIPTAIRGYVPVHNRSSSLCFFLQELTH